jgi:hypothetical protein
MPNENSKFGIRHLTKGLDHICPMRPLSMARMKYTHILSRSLPLEMGETPESQENRTERDVYVASALDHPPASPRPAVLLTLKQAKARAPVADDASRNYLNTALWHCPNTPPLPEPWWLPILGSLALAGLIVVAMWSF